MPTAAVQNIPYSKTKLLFTSINQKLAFFRPNLWTVGLMYGKNKLLSLCCLAFYALIPRKHTEGLRLRRGASAITLSPRASCLIPMSEPTVEALRELSWDLKWKGAWHKRNGVQPGKKRMSAPFRKEWEFCHKWAASLQSNVNMFKEVLIIFFFLFLVLAMIQKANTKG